MFDWDLAKHRAPMKRRAERILRKNPSAAERTMWRHLRGRQLAKLRFRRQQPIGPYVVDFYCSAAKLIVELGGGQHGERGARIYDHARTAWFRARGYRVFRIWNTDFFENPEGTLDAIYRAIEEAGVPLPEIR